MHAVLFLRQLLWITIEQIHVQVIDYMEYKQILSCL